MSDSEACDAEGMNHRLNAETGPPMLAVLLLSPCWWLSSVSRPRSGCKSRSDTSPADVDMPHTSKPLSSRALRSWRTEASGACSIVTTEVTTLGETHLTSGPQDSWRACFIVETQERQWRLASRNEVETAETGSDGLAATGWRRRGEEGDMVVTVGNAIWGSPGGMGAREMPCAFRLAGAERDNVRVVCDSG